MWVPTAGATLVPEDMPADDGLNCGGQYRTTYVEDVIRKTMGTSDTVYLWVGWHCAFSCEIKIIVSRSRICQRTRRLRQRLDAVRDSFVQYWHGSSCVGGHTAIHSVIDWLIMYVILAMRLLRIRTLVSN